MSPMVCRDCRDIADEIIRSYQDMWGSADPVTPGCVGGEDRVIGGTEEDVLRGKDLFSRANMKAAHAIGRAVLRKFAQGAKAALSALNNATPFPITAILQVE